MQQRVNYRFRRNFKSISNRFFFVKIVKVELCLMLYLVDVKNSKMKEFYFHTIIKFISSVELKIGQT